MILRVGFVFLQLCISCIVAVRHFDRNNRYYSDRPIDLERETSVQKRPYQSTNYLHNYHSLVNSHSSKKQVDPNTIRSIYSLLYPYWGKWRPSLKLDCPYMYTKVGETCLSLACPVDFIGWKESRLFCRVTKGGDLAVFNTDKDMADALGFIRTIDKYRNCSYWVGASDEAHEGHWTWNNGIKMSTKSPPWGHSSNSKKGGQNGGRYANNAILHRGDNYFLHDVSDVEAAAAKAVPLCQVVPYDYYMKQQHFGHSRQHKIRKSKTFPHVGKRRDQSYVDYLMNHYDLNTNQQNSIQPLHNINTKVNKKKRIGTYKRSKTSTDEYTGKFILRNILPLSEDDHPINLEDDFSMSGDAIKPSVTTPSSLTSITTSSTPIKLNYVTKTSSFVVSTPTISMTITPSVTTPSASSVTSNYNEVPLNRVTNIRSFDDDFRFIHPSKTIAKYASTQTILQNVSPLSSTTSTTKSTITGIRPSNGNALLPIQSSFENYYRPANSHYANGAHSEYHRVNNPFMQQFSQDALKKNKNNEREIGFQSVPSQWSSLNSIGHHVNSYYNPAIVPSRTDNGLVNIQFFFNGHHPNMRPHIVPNFQKPNLTYPHHSKQLINSRKKRDTNYPHPMQLINSRKKRDTNSADKTKEQIKLYLQKKGLDDDQVRPNIRTRNVIKDKLDGRHGPPNLKIDAHFFLKAGHKCKGHLHFRPYYGHEDDDGTEGFYHQIHHDKYGQSTGDYITYGKQAHSHVELTGEEHLCGDHKDNLHKGSTGGGTDQNYSNGEDDGYHSDVETGHHSDVDNNKGMGYPSGQETHSYPSGQGTHSYPNGQETHSYPSGQGTHSYPNGQETHTHNSGHYGNAPVVFYPNRPNGFVGVVGVHPHNYQNQGVAYPTDIDWYKGLAQHGQDNNYPVLPYPQGQYQGGYTPPQTYHESVHEDILHKIIYETNDQSGANTGTINTNVHNGGSYNQNNFDYLHGWANGGNTGSPHNPLIPVPIDGYNTHDSHSHSDYAPVPIDNSHVNTGITDTYNNPLVPVPIDNSHINTGNTDTSSNQLVPVPIVNPNIYTGNTDTSNNQHVPVSIHDYNTGSTGSSQSHYAPIPIGTGNYYNQYPAFPYAGLTGFTTNSDYSNHPYGFKSNFVPKIFSRFTEFLQQKEGKVENKKPKS